MDITPLIKSGQQVVEGYGPGFFRIAGKRWAQPVIVMPDVTVALSYEPGNDDDFCHLMAEILRFAQNDKAIEILLIGTGENAAMISPEVRQAFRDVGVSIDVMDTAAACRTYNVLMPEGRVVAAALIPV